MNLRLLILLFSAFVLFSSCRSTKKVYNPPAQSSLQFDSMDSNGDGNITKNEFQEITISEKNDAIGPSIAFGLILLFIVLCCFFARRVSTING